MTHTIPPVPEPRTIFHVDMDAFFAAIEQLDDPELRGKPVLVGGDGPRGVVATANYEARKFGCHSAQPMSIAKRRCPQAIVAKPRGRRYRQAADQIFAIYDDFAPLVQPLSIDEAFLDMTGTRRLLGEPIDVAKKLKQRIFDETQLTGSVGIAPNKFLAKMASDIDKPDGLTVITEDMIDTWLPTLPVSQLWGVGPAAGRKLETMGVRAVADIRRYKMEDLRRRLGEFGEHIWRLAHGIDDRKVTPDHEAKSIGHEQTFAADITDADEIRRVMLGQAEQVARRLRKHQRKTRTVTVKIRYGDFETITRSATLDEPTDLTDTLWHTARSLFDAWTFQPVRLIGVTASQLTTGGQMSLFGGDESDRRHAVDEATDAIVEKFGKKAIRRAGPGE